MKPRALLLMLSTLLLLALHAGQAQPSAQVRPHQGQKWTVDLQGVDIEFLFDEVRPHDLSSPPGLGLTACVFDFTHPPIPPALLRIREGWIALRPCEPAANPCSPRDPPQA